MGQEDRREAGRQESGHAESREQEEMTLHEEQARVDIQARERHERVHKHVTEEPAHRDVSHSMEVAEVEYAAAGPEDSGEVEVLPDGSISIPLMEEELVVSKRTVVRERIIIRKQVRTEEQRIETTLRREHAELETEGEELRGDERAA